MPCLWPTLIGTTVGVFILISGTLMSFIGYDPIKFLGIPEEDKTKNRNGTANGTGLETVEGLRVLAYVGPVFMGIGFFVMIVAVVLYCEIKEKYVCNILPQHNVNVKNVQRDVLYDMIIDEFRKNYFRGIQVPIPKRTAKQKAMEQRYPTLFKALSISTPALIITPEIQRKWRDSCEASPNPSRARRRKYLYDTWLKTSSLPNIRARAGQRQALRHERRHQRRMAFQDRVSKSCDHHDMQSKSVDATKGEDRGSCFDNPAFRTSPTQGKIPPEIQVSPPTSPDTEGVSLTQVSVHVEGSGTPNGRITHSMSCGADDSSLMFSKVAASSKSLTSDIMRFDARGFTLKRTLHPQSCIDLCDDEDTSDKQVLVKLDSAAVQKNLQSQSQPGIARKDRITMYHKPGPHRTLIGIFRSESCLDRIKRLTKPNSEKDNESLDSFTLSDDILRNFEMAEFSQS